MSTFGIQGQPLEITVVGCNKLKNTEWITRQDPYVCIEYGSSKFRTRTCKDGGKNPTFQEKFVLSLIEGLREFSVNVWNRNTLTYDDFIGSGKVQLQRVLSTGYDDSSWALQDKKGRHAGEVRLILHYADAYKPVTSHLPSVSPYSVTPGPQVSLYSAPPVSSYPPTSIPAPAHSLSYPPNPAVYPPPSAPPSYPPNQAVYPPPSAPPSYPPNPALYPPPSAPSPSYPPSPAVYPPPSYHQPPTYPPTYPPGPSPSVYPQHSVYPPPSNDPHYYPPGLYPPSPYHPRQY
ncbi:uncharacterized protein [Primulina eburnea]|uniref:uncharacterized protein n=1 Tax=Primulina eburnea TaxID=1245227 RepID=UPI003C6BE825